MRICSSFSKDLRISPKNWITSRKRLGSPTRSRTRKCKPRMTHHLKFRLRRKLRLASLENGHRKRTFPKRNGRSRSPEALFSRRWLLERITLSSFGTRRFLRRSRKGIFSRLLPRFPVRLPPEARHHLRSLRLSSKPRHRRNKKRRNRRHQCPRHRPPGTAHLSRKPRNRRRSRRRKRSLPRPRRKAARKFRRQCFPGFLGTTRSSIFPPFGA